MNQHEITERRPLLDASGNLTEPGYAKTLLPIYRRSDIKAGKMRIKEWDYYCILQFQIAFPRNSPPIAPDDNRFVRASITASGKFSMNLLLIYTKNTKSASVFREFRS